MLALLFSACALQQAQPVAQSPQVPLRPALPTTSNSVAVPAAPSGCVLTARVQVATTACRSFAGSPLGESGWTSTGGELSGTTGECAFMCRAESDQAQWLLRSEVDGWVGTATCSVAEVGAMEFRSTSTGPDRVKLDPAVGAMWLITGADSWGIAEVVHPHGDVQLGITTNGCPGGQPTR